MIVGGGIAGGALAKALAGGGRSVLVLERSGAYTDRVKGEFVHMWGVVEAKRLGLMETLEQGVRANLMSRYIPFDESLPPAQAEAQAIPLGSLMRGIKGPLGVSHPKACAALEDQAVEAGARVVRGVSALRVRAQPKPEVSWEANGEQFTATCRLIVGADGRESSVRRQVGIPLHSTEPRLLGAGLLVEVYGQWTSSDFSIGTEGDRIFFVFPQGDGRVRLYLLYDADDRHRLAGADKADRFLEGFGLESIPDSGRFSQAKPVGPCAVYPMFDSWTESPVDEGVVLVGDAAGFNDPIIGEGLSIALRDARMVSELLLASDEWAPELLAPYVQERGERMRRLRFMAKAYTDVRWPMGPGGADDHAARVARWSGADPDLFQLQVACLLGPETAPPEAFTEEVYSRLLAPA
ncbi:MAG: NAD(P)/FAD-dependent oxidoreductase [Acidimicrobiales bacterium]